MAEIKITVDNEAKAITGVVFPEDMDTPQILIVLNQVCIKLISQIKMSNKGKIEVPKKKLIKV